MSDSIAKLDSSDDTKPSSSESNKSKLSWLTRDRIRREVTHEVHGACLPIDQLERCRVNNREYRAKFPALSSSVTLVSIWRKKLRLALQEWANLGDDYSKKHIAIAERIEFVREYISSLEHHITEMRRRNKRGDIMSPKDASDEKKLIKERVIASVNKAQSLRKDRIKNASLVSWQKNFVAWYREQSWMQAEAGDDVDQIEDEGAIAEYKDELRERMVERERIQNTVDGKTVDEWADYVLNYVLDGTHSLITLFTAGVLAMYSGYSHREGRHLEWEASRFLCKDDKIRTPLVLKPDGTAFRDWEVVDQLELIRIVFPIHSSTSGGFTRLIETEIHRRMFAVEGLKKGINMNRAEGRGNMYLRLNAEVNHHIYITASWKIARELNQVGGPTSFVLNF